MGWMGVHMREKKPSHLSTKPVTYRPALWWWMQQKFLFKAGQLLTSPSQLSCMVGIRAEVRVRSIRQAVRSVTAQEGPISAAFWVQKHPQICLGPQFLHPKNRLENKRQS